MYADGKLGAGALVDAAIAMPESLKEAYRARTDAAGNYVLANLSRDREIPEIRVSLGEYADLVRGVSFSRQAELTLDFELELNTSQRAPGRKLAVPTPREERRRTLSGRISRSDASAVEGALVTFGDRPGTLNYSATQTDTQGRYSLAAVTSRSALAVQAQGCAPAFQFVLTRGDAQFDFVLKPGHWIEGRTLDQQGKPVANVAVRAEASTLFGDKRDRNRYPRYPLANSRAVSGADGKFRLEDLPAAGVLVTMWATGYTPVQARAMEVDQPSQVLTLLPIGRIAGRVVRLSDGLPVADFTVYAVKEDQVPAGKPYEGRVPIYQYRVQDFSLAGRPVFPARPEHRPDGGGGDRGSRLPA